jgi:hypothetical protein
VKETPLENPRLEVSRSALDEIIMGLKENI